MPTFKTTAYGLNSNTIDGINNGLIPSFDATDLAENTPFSITSDDNTLSVGDQVNNIDAGGLLVDNQIQAVKSLTLVTDTAIEPVVALRVANSTNDWLLPANNDGDGFRDASLELSGAVELTGELGNRVTDVPEDTFLLDFVADNQAPIARDDSVTTDEGVAAIIDVLMNDEDPDGEDNALRVTEVSSENGDVRIGDDNQLVYTPSEGFFGSDSLAYTITDGEGATASANVAVTVNEIDDPIVNPGEPSEADDSGSDAGGGLEFLLLLALGAAAVAAASGQMGIPPV